MVGINLNPTPYECTYIAIVKYVCNFKIPQISLSFQNLEGCSRLYDGYCKIQVAMGNRSICAWDSSNYENQYIFIAYI